MTKTVKAEDKYKARALEIMMAYYLGAWAPGDGLGLTATIANALRKAAADAYEDAAEMANHYCCFDDHQQPRHSWHDKQYMLDQIRAKAASLRSGKESK